METVDLIASGYDWDCPHCGFMNTEIETLPVVKCKDCREKFTVLEIEHAHGKWNSEV